MAARPLKRFELSPSRLFPGGWSGTVADLRNLQSELAHQVVPTGAVRGAAWVAGVDVGLGRFGRIARAAAVLLRVADLEPVAEAVVELPVELPYIPGLLSFRELPSVLEALAQLPQAPDLILCDGHGIAHTRRFGIACHLGIVTGVPTIGVAKSVLTGRHDELVLQRGASQPLVANGETIGMVVCSRKGVRPLVISPGHRIGLDSAVKTVLSMTAGYRLPEPTRLADRLSKVKATWVDPLPLV